MSLSLCVSFAAFLSPPILPSVSFSSLLVAGSLLIAAIPAQSSRVWVCFFVPLVPFLFSLCFVWCVSPFGFVVAGECGPPATTCLNMRLLTVCEACFAKHCLCNQLGVCIWASVGSRDSHTVVWRPCACAVFAQCKHTVVRLGSFGEGSRRADVCSSTTAATARLCTL